MPCSLFVEERAAAQRCAQEERAAPLLRELDAVLDGKQLVAAEAVVTHCDGLVGMYGGKAERARWAELRRRLRVVRAEDLGPREGLAPEGPALDLAALGDLEPRHRAVLAVAEAERALTLTANGALVWRAAAQGVRLPAHVHRTHFLTGQ